MSTVLLVVSIICAIVAAWLGFGVFSGAHLIGWLSLSVAFLGASLLVSQVPRP